MWDFFFWWFSVTNNVFQLAKKCYFEEPQANAKFGFKYILRAFPKKKKKILWFKIEKKRERSTRGLLDISIGNIKS